jgi:YD repeat-containing protein
VWGGVGGVIAPAAVVRLAWVGLLLVVCAFGVAVLGAGSALAEPFCTDSWTGPASGSWGTAADWSAERVPSATDVACIGAGKAVTVSEGGDQAGAVEVEGSLAIVGGSLEVASALEVSKVASLRLNSGTLTGPGTLDVTGSLAWEEAGVMSGSGTTFVEPGVSASITGSVCTKADLVERRLVNDGVMTLGPSAETIHLGLSEGARLENAGVFDDNAGGECSIAHLSISEDEGSRMAASIVNTGTFQNTEGRTGVTFPVKVALDNDGGKLDGGVEALAFVSAPVTLAGGSVLEGDVEFAGSHVTAEGISVPGAAVTLSEAATLEVPATEISSFADLSLLGADVTGSGTLEDTGMMVWGAGSMSGAGETLVQGGASASIAAGEGDHCEEAKLVGRVFVNDGTVTLGSAHRNDGGSMAMSEGARLDNAGVFNDDAVGAACTPNRSTIVEGEGSKTAPMIVNSGTFQQSEDEDNKMKYVEVPFNNEGTVFGEDKELSIGQDAGGLGFRGAPVTLASSSVLKGTIGAFNATVTGDDFVGAGASLTLSQSAKLTIASGDTVSLNSLTLEDATVAGAGTLDVISSLEWEQGGVMSGAGKTVLEGGGKGEILKEGASCDATLEHRTFVNDGTITYAGNSSDSSIEMSHGARLDNNGVFEDDSAGGWYECTPELWYTFREGPGARSRIVNTGLFERTGENREEPQMPIVPVPFENWGRTAGTLFFLNKYDAGSKAWGCSEEDPSFPKREVATEQGVCVGSGDLSETQTDFSIGGRGLGLNLTRTYNSQAAQEGFKSVFGYGWTFPYSDHLTIEAIEEPVYEEGPEGEEIEKTVVHHFVTVVEENGNVVEFTEGSGSGEWMAPAGSPDVLTGSESAGFTLTLEDREVYKFAGSSGRLESITERLGNTTTMTYNGGGQLEKVTDPSGRSLKFAYNGEGLVKSATDPMEHTIEYGYKEGALISVSQPNEPTVARWKFAYEAPGHEGEHTAQLIEIVDGRGGKTAYKYNGAHRVKSETDPRNHTTAYEYGHTYTKITNEATGAVMDEETTSTGQLVEAIHGVGTTDATTEAFTYDTAGRRDERNRRR